MKSLMSKVNLLEKEQIPVDLVENIFLQVVSLLLKNLAFFANRRAETAIKYGLRYRKINVNNRNQLVELISKKSKTAGN